MSCAAIDTWAAAIVSAAYLIVCAGIALSALYRIARMDAGTDWRVRWSFLLLLGAGAAAGTTALLGLRAVSWPELLLGAAILAVQAVAARLWARAVPQAYSAHGGAK